MTKEDERTTADRNQQQQADAGPDQVQAEDIAARLQALEAERDDLYKRLQRVSADYANYQKRVPKQIAESLAHEQERLLRSLLPICDHLEMAIQQYGPQATVQSVLEGVRIVYDQLLGLLRCYEVEPIKAADQCFDPRFHEALLTRCEPNKPDRVVLEECQRGYTRGGRVLRPSKVIVNAVQQDQARQGQADGDQGSQAQSTEVSDSQEE